MTAPGICVLFPGVAREALEFYQACFGGELRVFTYADFNRTDGPADAVAFGVLSGEVDLQGADAAAGQQGPVEMANVMLSLLTTDPEQQRARWATLSDGGRVLDDLQQRPWGDWDGELVDRYGLRWLIGFKG